MDPALGVVAVVEMTVGADLVELFPSIDQVGYALELEPMDQCLSGDHS